MHSSRHPADLSRGAWRARARALIQRLFGSSSSDLSEDDSSESSSADMSENTVFPYESNDLYFDELMEIGHDSDSSNVTIDESQDDTVEENVSNVNVYDDLHDPLINDPIVEFEEELKNWVLKWNIVQEATNELLAILKRNRHEQLPKNYKTLCDTPTQTLEVKIIPPGVFYNFGLQRMCQELDRHYKFSSNAEYASDGYVKFTQRQHIDGVSLSKSSNLRAWTCLSDIIELKDLEPILVGCFVGYSDPTDFDLYLSDFVDDNVKGATQGFIVNIDTGFKIYVKTQGYVMDAPARSKALHVMGHSAKHGCSCCSQVGEKRRSEGIQFQNQIVMPLKTNETFRSRTYLEEFQSSHKHHQGKFEEILDADMVIDFVIDPMHTLFLGAMKKHIQLIFAKDVPDEYKLDTNELKILSRKYEKMASSKPIEMKRRPRDLQSNVKYLKAVENSDITCYYGFHLFKNTLNPDMYEHLCKFMIAVRLLAEEDLEPSGLDVAQQLIEEYVFDFSKFYGPHLSYVIHACLHLKQYSEKFGPLYEWSAFKFENALRPIKSLIHVQNRVIQQIYRRTTEKGMLRFKKERDVGLSLPIGHGYFAQYSFGKRATFNCKKKADSFLCVKDENVYYLVRLIKFYQNDDSIMFEAKKVTTIGPVFTINHSNFTLPSSDVGIWQCLMEPDALVLNYSIDQICYKCFYIKDAQQQFMLIPYLHQVHE